MMKFMFKIMDRQYWIGLAIGIALVLIMLPLLAATPWHVVGQ